MLSGHKMIPITKQMYCVHAYPSNLKSRHVFLLSVLFNNQQIDEKQKNEDIIQQRTCNYQSLVVVLFFPETPFEVIIDAVSTYRNPPTIQRKQLAQMGKVPCSSTCRIHSSITRKEHDFFSATFSSQGVLAQIQDFVSQDFL